MASQNVHEFTTDNFQAQVLDADGPVLVDFWAEWCMPCRMLAPTIDQIADEFAGKAKVGKVDTDNNQAIGVQYEISAIPTVIIFHAGQPVRKFVGLTNKADLAAALNDLV
ncbi:MAG: thioredoxin [Phycisphaerales bacterium]|nr:thioredoxin [Phycisphaerales bacterium]